MRDSIIRTGVGVVVYNDKGEILVGKRKGSHQAGKWQLPGGYIDNWESVLDCAKRELYEETDLEALSLRQGPYEELIDKEENIHHISLFVIVNAFNGEVKLKEKDKCEGWYWMSPKDVPQPRLPPLDMFIKKLNPV